MSVLKIKKEDGTWEVISGGSSNAGSVDIDLNGSNEGAANLINADTLGGRVAADYATQSFVMNKIAAAQLSGGESGNIDLSGYATKDDIAEITADSLGAIKISQIINDFTITEEGYVADARALKALNDNKIEMELVWEKADTTESMAAGSLPLTSSDFSHFMIDFIGRQPSLIIRNGTRYNCSYMLMGGRASGSTTNHDTTLTFYVREIDFRDTGTTNAVAVADCYYTYFLSDTNKWLAETRSNGAIVPYRIWGIRGIAA